MAKTEVGDSSAQGAHITQTGRSGVRGKKSGLKSEAADADQALERFSDAVLEVIQTIRKEAEGDSSLKRFANALLGQLNRLKQIASSGTTEEGALSTVEVVDRIYSLVELADQAIHRDLNPLKVREITPGRFTFEVASETRVRFNSWSFDTESRSFSEPLFSLAATMESESTVFETSSFKVMKRQEGYSDTYILSKQFGFCGTVMIYVGSETSQVNFDCMHNDHLSGEVVREQKLTLGLEREQVKNDLMQPIDDLGSKAA